MNVYPDTSFLCAIYREQDNSAEADALFDRLLEPLPVTALLLFEFRHSVRWHTFLHRNDATKGYGEREGKRMLASLENDLTDGVLRIVVADWPNVLSAAERLSARHTRKGGQRGFDILHVATALELGAKELLTFDSRQAELATAAGLKPQPQ